MNVRLDYQSGHTYSEHFSNFKTKVSASGSAIRVHISFRQKDGSGTPYAAFSLPREKARQLAHAMLTASVGDAEPIEFIVDESTDKKRTS